jgi:hypothetical protein
MGVGFKPINVIASEAKQSILLQACQSKEAGLLRRKSSSQ